MNPTLFKKLRDMKSSIETTVRTDVTAGKKPSDTINHFRTELPESLIL